MKTLWKEFKILLLDKNGDHHLDDDEESVIIIAKDTKDNAYDDLLTYNEVTDKSEHELLKKKGW